jgi:hypothetical protein
MESVSEGGRGIGRIGGSIAVRLQVPTRTEHSKNGAGRFTENGRRLQPESQIERLETRLKRAGCRSEQSNNALELPQQAVRLCLRQASTVPAPVEPLSLHGGRSG